MLQTIVGGLIQGAIYGLVAVGLVLVYKGAKIFNFAQGEFGTVAAFAAWNLQKEGVGVPLWIAMIAALVAAVLFGLLTERLIIRPMTNAPRVNLLVATAALAVATISTEIVIGEATGRVLPGPVPAKSVTIFGAGVSLQQLLILAMLGLVAVGLYLFFSRTALGVAILATSQDAMASRLSGISTNRVSAFVWGLAALLGGLAGLLQAPVTVFYPGFMTVTVLLPAFAGAVLGGMTSLPGAFVGGLAIGVAQALGGRYFPETITGGAEITVFALLLLVLLVRPQGLLGKET